MAISKYLRNWWIDANVDGRKNRLCGGPEHGGFTMVIRQGSTQRWGRRGRNVPVARITGEFLPDPEDLWGHRGKLKLTIQAPLDINLTGEAHEIIVETQRR